MVLDEYISSFITYELELGIYTFRYLSKALLNILQPEYELLDDSVIIEIDNITMKAKLVVRPVTIDIKFHEKSFFSTIFGFKPYWDYKHYNENISQKNVNLSTKNKIHFKADVFDGSEVNGLRQAILFSFVLDKTIRL